MSHQRPADKCSRGAVCEAKLEVANLTLVRVRAFRVLMGTRFRLVLLGGVLFNAQ